MKYSRKSLCFVSITPLTLSFFFRAHLSNLVKCLDVYAIHNFNDLRYCEDLDPRVRQIKVKLTRRISLFGDLLSVFELYHVLRRFRFDLVVSVAPKAGLVAMVAASLCGIKERIHIFQGEVWASRSGPMRLLLKSADRLTALLATRVLVVSKSELNFLITEGVLKAVDKAQVLGEGTICGVNLNKFRPNPDKRKEVRSALSIPNHAVICLFLGRLSKDKGLFDLALAFSGAAKEVHNLYLVITGPDEERIIGRVFQKIPTELQFRVRYTGFSYAPQDILSSADFLCLPSYREGFGMVILEAAAVGIPSIANDIYGIRDAIEAGRTGELVPVKNIKDLKSMMIIWSKNPSMLAEYGSLARSRVREKFDQELVIKLYTQYFNVIAEGIKK